MLRDEVTVEVRDRNLARKGTITTKNLSLKATIRHLGVGEWELTLPRQHPMIDHLLTTGSGIIVSLRGSTLFSGVTTRPRRDTNLQNPDGTYTFKGVTDDVLLLDSLAFPSPAIADPGAQDASNDVQTGNAETLMRHYVSANICNGVAPVSRTEGFRQYLRLATSNENRGITLTKAPRFQNLMELLYEIAIGADLGFQVIQRDNDLVFEVLTLTDRSDLVRLDIKNGTITSEASEVSAPSITRAIVAGSGEGVGRLIIERTSTSSAQSENDWGRVIEQFVDQRNAADVVELQQSGDEKLIAGQLATTAIKIVPSDDQTMIYGADWEVGDTIAVVIDGVEAKTTVTAMTMIVNDQVAAIGAAIGDITEFDADAALVKRVENVETRTANLERSEASGGGGGAASDVEVTVKNKTGVTLYKGQAVYIVSSDGENLNVALAQANSEATSSKTMGLLKQDLANDAIGVMITEGFLDNIDTSGLTAGDPMWLSPTTPGGIVFGLANKPSAPNHMVFLGYVLRIQSNNGGYYVKIQNGFENDELHDRLTYVGDTAPPNPKDYYWWWCSADGTMFFRYNDGTSSQWVEIKNSAGYISNSRLDTIEARLTALEIKTVNSVVQIIQATKTDSQTGACSVPNYYDVTGLSITFTPKYANSKFLISFVVQGSATYDGTIRIVRNGGTVVGAGSGGTQNSTSFINVRGNTYEGNSSVGEFFDQTNSISPVTYKVQVGGNGNYWINREPSSDSGERTISTLTIKEVAQ